MQARVGIGIAAATAGGHGQFLDDAREHLAALGVGRALLVLNRVPLGMAGHDAKLPLEMLAARIERGLKTPRKSPEKAE